MQAWVLHGHMIYLPWQFFLWHGSNQSKYYVLFYPLFMHSQAQDKLFRDLANSFNRCVRIWWNWFWMCFLRILLYFTVYNYFMPSWATVKIIAPGFMSTWCTVPKAVRPKTTVHKVVHSTEGAMVLTCPRRHEKVVLLLISCLYSFLKHTIEPPRVKPTKCLCAQRRRGSAWASAQSDQSLRCVLNG